MLNVEIDKPGKNVLLMGNEAIARGAIEAGVNFTTAYPGTPSSEIMGTLAKVADKFGFYAEWSTNEKVALEAAGAAAFTGLRSLCAMKHQGVNVCADFLTTVNLTDTKGGFILLVCDDPSAHSSTQEEDTRNFARFVDIPLLEPSSIQEAKDMVKWAFELSENLKLICMMRSVTRISHARGNVKLGEISKEERKASLPMMGLFISAPPPPRHTSLHKKLDKARKLFEKSEFNWYSGPEDAEFVIITSGTGWAYSQEALTLLGIKDKVGTLKLGTTWPLPENLVLNHLKHAQDVLVIEETDPFLEQNVKILTAEMASEVGVINFYGKHSKHIKDTGEIDVGSVIKAISKLKNLEYMPRDKDYAEKAKKLSGSAPFRMLGFCAGCPHRPSFWAIKVARKWDDRDAYVCGDIGCYALGVGPAGFMQLKTLHCMGSGIGVATGFGNLRKFGFDRPVIAVAGDSTFYHACIPALINAKYNGADVLFIILDNSATAMTGFQPHPGTGVDARGNPAPTILPEKICEGIGIDTEVIDPFDVRGTTELIYEMLQKGGTNAIVLRRTCGLIEARRKGKVRVYVDPSKCIGDECGCARFCSRVFNCPGMIWDFEAQKAKIDEAVCTGCGVCAQLCPQDAIIVEEV